MTGESHDGFHHLRKSSGVVLRRSQEIWEVCPAEIVMPLFSFLPEEMGKEYKYLKNMFHMYQVRASELCGRF